jgi:predicted DNA-binding WGR domain protein
MHNALRRTAAMSLTYLERRNPNRNEARYYMVRVLPTLFGEWAVVREWGRIGSPGTVRTEWFGSEEAAGGKLADSKVRRGYRRAES